MANRHSAKHGFGLAQVGLLRWRMGELKADAVGAASSLFGLTQNRAQLHIATK